MGPSAATFSEVIQCHGRRAWLPASALLCVNSPGAHSMHEKKRNEKSMKSKMKSKKSKGQFKVVTFLTNEVLTNEVPTNVQWYCCHCKASTGKSIWIWHDQDWAEEARRSRFFKRTMMHLRFTTPLNWKSGSKTFKSPSNISKQKKISRDRKTWKTWNLECKEHDYESTSLEPHFKPFCVFAAKLI